MPSNVLLTTLVWDKLSKTMFNECSLLLQQRLNIGGGGGNISKYTNLFIINSCLVTKIIYYSLFKNIWLFRRNEASQEDTPPVDQNTLVIQVTYLDKDSFGSILFTFRDGWVRKFGQFFFFVPFNILIIFKKQYLETQIYTLWMFVPNYENPR